MVLVVAAVEMHPRGGEEFERVQQQQELDTLRPAVDEVAVEHKLRLLRGPAEGVDNVQQVVELPVLANEYAHAHAYIAEERIHINRRGYIGEDRRG